MQRAFSTHALYLRSRRIALYFANDGEPDLLGLFRWAQGHNKQWYLPRIGADFRLDFMRLRDLNALNANRFGILEAEFCAHDRAPAWTLDLALVPLVAFDSEGRRLGRGAGYYDRCFSFRRLRQYTKPFLLGVAWQFQQLACVERHAWDVPLDGVLTENGLRIFRQPIAR